jgi:tRNA (cmo5U34)-methyltransferase
MMTIEDPKDRVYATPRDRIDEFEFDDAVADVFPDMIQRSVPGYRTTISTIGVLAERYAQPGSACFDLGCSLGAATLAMRHRIPHDDCRIIAVDKAAAMVERCRHVMERDHSRIPVEVIEADLLDVAVADASVVVMNFTLQFIPPEHRQSLIDRIYDGMRPGGIFVLSEKVRFSDPHLDELHIDLHHAFKRSNGYSDMEIAQKRQALENVLVPDTLSTHRQRMSQAGFGSCDVWFQCFNFASLLALK